MKFAPLLISLGVISALIGCGGSDTALSHIEKAKSLQASEIDAKLIELKNAVKLESKNAEARYLLGEAYLSQGFAFGAVKELEKAYEYSYDKNKIIPLLARSYILTSSDEDVLDLDQHTTALSKESAVHYLAYKTLAEIRVGNLEGANSSVEQADIILAGSAFSHLARAYIEMAEGALDKAKDSINKTLTIIPNQLDALLLLGQVNTAQENYTEATINYTKYAKLQPKSSIIVLFLAQSLLKEGKYLEAEKYADTILASSPNQPFANYIKATSQFQLKNYQEANKYAELALKAQFNQGPLKLIAGISSYLLGNFEQSHHHLEPIVQYLTPRHPARKMFALSQLQLGLLDEITETLDGFNAQTDDDDKFLSTLSYKLAELGAVDNAKLIAGKTINKTPDGAEQNMREGILKLMLNDPSGMDNLKNAVELNPNMPGAELALAYAAIQVKDYAQATEIAESWKQKYPEKVGGYNVLAAVYLKQGEIDSAKAEMYQSLKVSGKNIFALLELTNLAMLENDNPEALRLSDFAVNEFPENTKVLRQYYSIRRDEAALNKIKALHELNKNNLPVALLYAEVLINTQKNNEAAVVLNEFKNTVQSPKQLWKLKIASQKGAENNNKAIQLLEEWIDVNPYHVEPVVMLSDFYGRKKDLAKALRIIDKALSGPHEKNKMLQLGKMQLLIDLKNVYRSKEYFKILKEEKINGVLAQGIEGKIALLDKDYKKASKLLAGFYNENPLAKNALLLNKALQGINKNTTAIELLEFHLENNDKDNNVRLALANNYLSSSPDKAIIEYKIILEAHPNSIMVLNNLAWLTMENGSLEDALTYSESAFKLMPTDMNIMDTKAMILLKLNRKGEALSLLVQAFELSHGNNNDITLNYVETLIANKRFRKAEQVLDSLKETSVKQKNRLLELRKSIK